MGSVPPDPARLARAPDPGFGARVSAEVECTVDAPMERVWALLRDYRLARPRLLTEHFSDYAVQHRGEGAGTVIAYRLWVGRHQRDHVISVEEPVPGRMLRERAGPWGTMERKVPLSRPRGSVDCRSHRLQNVGT